MNLTISEESAQFLKELYTRLTTQSNRYTAEPYYFTVRKDVLVPAFEECGTEILYSSDDFDGLRFESDLSEYADEIGITVKEYIDTYCEQHEMIYEERHQGVFFTEKACEDFIKYKSHHIIGKNIGSYVEHAQYNPEFLQIKNLLKELGAQIK